MEKERTLKDGAEIICTIEEGGVRVKIPWSYVPKPLSAVALSEALEAKEITEGGKEG